MNDSAGVSLIMLYSHLSTAFSFCCQYLCCWILGYIKSCSYTKTSKQHKSFTARQNGVMNLNGFLKVGFAEMSRDFEIILLNHSEFCG